MRSSVLVARFEREMEAVGALDHPHIVRAMDAGEFGGTHFLVMEYVEGSDLSALVKEQGTLSVRDACKVIRQAAMGLQHAHEHGLVHRDIKPSNIFVTKAGQVKLLDLGLARISRLDDEHAGITSSGQVLGTPDYMSPEQWDDTHSVDARADLYALGCALHFVLTGYAPFSAEGSRPSMTRLMRAHVEGSIPDLIAARSDVPAALNEIHRRLMAKKAEDRFQKAAEVVDALEPFTRRSGDSPDNSPVSPKVVAAAPDRTQTTPPVAGQVELGGDVDSPTMAIVGESTTQTSTKRQRVVSSTTTRQWLIAVGLLACVVLAAVFSGVGRVKKPTDVVANNASRSRSSTHPTDESSLKPLTPNPSSWHGWPADAPLPAIAPFDAEQAQQHQEAWAEFLKVPVEYTNTIGMKFRLIPPGEFTMGSTPAEIEAALKDVGDDKRWQESFKSEAPQHKVILTQPIYLGVKEVTQAEYEKVMGVNPSLFAPTGMGKEAVAGLETAEHPVEMVSWNDAAEFCAKLSKQEKFKQFHFRAGETITPLDGAGYRLPSEAEWEFACRAGTTTKYWIGDQDEDLVRAVWFRNSGGRTHAAGELKTNPFGLYDIHGNVWEWVQDGWDAAYYGQFQDKPAINPNGTFSASPQRMIRGGGWIAVASQCRSSVRFDYGAQDRYYCLGFRPVLTVDSVRQTLKVTGPAMPKPVATTSSTPASN
jgi:formylglycine-generating enzyme required for sulfatase activity